jgi:hypothetical protein
LVLFPGVAKAVDGCLVQLCLAAPSWRALPLCVPAVQQLFRDLARGKSFPSCPSSVGSIGVNTWASAPSFCPAQYIRVFEGVSQPHYECDYTGAISILVNGALFSRTWWSFSGDSVTDFSQQAKQSLGRWDSRFDLEYAAWAAQQSAPTAQTAAPTF